MTSKVAAALEEETAPLPTNQRSAGDDIFVNRGHGSQHRNPTAALAATLHTALRTGLED